MKKLIPLKYVPYLNSAASVFWGFLNVFVEVYGYRNVLINVINRF
jgi:hypothetical protein